jgi:hypothetical protein
MSGAIASKGNEMEQIVRAISDKYGVSNDVSQQVLDALVALEKRRQAAAPSTGIGGMRGMGAERGLGSSLLGVLAEVVSGGGNKPGLDAGDVMGVVGNLLGGGQQESNRPGVDAGDLMGLLGGLLGSGGQQPSQGSSPGDMFSMLGGLLGGEGNAPSQQSHSGMSVLMDLLGAGGGQQPMQGGGDLANILSGLLGSGQNAGPGQAQGGMNIMDMVGSLLGGGTSSSQPHLPPVPPPQSPQHSNKPDKGSIGDALGGMISAAQKAENQKPDNPFQKMSGKKRKKQ